MINARARNYQVIVESTDVTDCCSGDSGGYCVIGEDSVSQSGHLKTSGSLQLMPAKGFSQSLDPRLNTKWQRGSKVEIKIASTLLGSPVLYRTLRILETPTPPTADRPGISIQLGDLLNLIDYRQCDTEEELFPIGEETDRRTIINLLLASIGGPQLAPDQGIPEYPLTYPPTRDNGSVVRQACQIAWEAGYALWINPDEELERINLRVDQIDRHTTFTLGEDDYSYQPVSARQRAFEKIKVFAVAVSAATNPDPEVIDDVYLGNVAQTATTIIGYEPTTELIYFGPGQGLVEYTYQRPIYAESEDIVVKRVIATTEIDYVNFVVTRNIKTYEILGSWLPSVKAEGLSSTTLSELIFTTEENITESYSSVSGLILTRQSYLRQVKGILYSDWVTAATSLASCKEFAQTPVITKESYRYDSDEVLVSQSLIKTAGISAYLHKFITSGTLNEGSITIEKKITDWSETRSEEWIVRVQSDGLYGLIYPYDPATPPSLNRASTLVTDRRNTFSSNDPSKARPSSGERFPAEIGVDEQELEVVVEFSGTGNSDYLQTEIELELTTCVSQDQLEEIAELHGSYTLGRQYSYDCQTFLPDWVYGSPLFKVQVIEPDVTYAAIAEAHTLELAADRCVFGFTTVHLGEF